MLSNNLVVVSALRADEIEPQAGRYNKSERYQTIRSGSLVESCLFTFLEKIEQPLLQNDGALMRWKWSIGIRMSSLTLETHSV
jgi:hypothetical protein